MLGQDFYPLTGTLREPLLIIEWVMVFLFSELAFLLYMRVKNRKRKLSNFIEKASILFLLAYSSMFVFYIVGDYYMETHLSRLVVYNIGYILRMILGLVFIYKIEKYQNIIAWFNGHNHAGNYGNFNMIHFVTIKGMVETETNNSFALVEVYRNKIWIKGYGREKSQILAY